MPDRACGRDYNPTLALPGTSAASKHAPVFRNLNRAGYCQIVFIVRNSRQLPGRAGSNRNPSFRVTVNQPSGNMADRGPRGRAQESLPHGETPAVRPRDSAAALTTRRRRAKGKPASPAGFRVRSSACQTSAARAPLPSASTLPRIAQCRPSPPEFPALHGFSVRSSRGTIPWRTRLRAWRRSRLLESSRQSWPISPR